MKKDNYYILSSLLLLFILILLPSGKADIPAKNLAANAVSAVIEVPKPEVEAKSAYAYDLSSGVVIFEKEKNAVMPLASIAKIGSALALLDILLPEEEIEISRSAILTPEKSSLKVGEHFFVRDLLAMAMVESTNDAVTALVEAAAQKNNILPEDSEEWFLDIVNAKANELQAFSMQFNNPTGLDISKDGLDPPLQAGAFGSAEDLIILAKATLDSELWQYGDIIEVTSKEGFIHALHPTNLLKKDISGIIGSKTGFTDLAGGNLLVLIQHPYPSGRIYGIVVLGSSEDGRFEDVKKIIEYIKSL